MSYELTVDQRPSYVHARATGERTPENALRFLKDAYVACVNSGLSILLLEMDFSGPALSASSIFAVINDRVPEGLRLNKIAYVDRSSDLSQAYFAETVAMNRGVNVRLFKDVATAEGWLSESVAAPRSARLA